MVFGSVGAGLGESLLHAHALVLPSGDLVSQSRVSRSGNWLNLETEQRVVLFYGDL